MKYLSSLGLLVGFSTLFGSESSLMNPSSPGILGLEKRLDDVAKTFNSSEGKLPEGFLAAKGKIKEVQTLIQSDPNSESRPQWEKTCSLFVESALLNMESHKIQEQISATRNERVNVLTEITNSMDEINKLERGYASSLKADLEEQKRRVKEAREQAEKQFDELNSALIQVKKDARGTIISMSDILFAVGKADLTEGLKTSLAKISGILTIYKDANVSIEGHTDNQGGEEFNQKLSEKRAENVMNFMNSVGGIKTQRLSSVGYAFSKPVSENDTKEGRQKNRRVDLVVMDKNTAK